MCGEGWQEQDTAVMSRDVLWHSIWRCSGGELEMHILPYSPLPQLSVVEGSTIPSETQSKELNS